MKRAKFLMPAIADMDNLRLAFWKARKGKDATRQVIGFRNELDKNLLLLQQELIDGRVQVGDYHYFTIYDPKERVICAAHFKERVLHHALMNVCHPIFEKVQIYDSYASRKGKGTYAALERGKYYTQRYKWCLKLDFRKYFDSIDHQILKQQLLRLFKDVQLLSIFEQIIDSYEVIPSKGVPIGNLTSQYFANHYLTGADHFARETLQAQGYVRYMDDMVFWDNDKERLQHIGKVFDEFAKEKLQLTLKPFGINKTQHGVPFLGYLLYPNKILLADRSKKRFTQKIKDYYQKLENGEWTTGIFQRHIQPLFAFTEHAHSKAFRSNILKKIEEVYRSQKKCR